MKAGLGLALIAISSPGAVAAQDRAFFGRGEILAGTVSRKSATPGANGGVRLGGNGSVPLGGSGFSSSSSAFRARLPLAGTTSHFVRRVSPTPFDALADGFVEDPDQAMEPPRR